MARFEPRRVLPYLKSRWGRYRLQPVLETCRNESSSLLTEAQAYLLEQDGRVEEAFQLLKADLVCELQAATAANNSTNLSHSNNWSNSTKCDNSTNNLKNSVNSSINSNNMSDSAQLMWSRINTKVILLIQLCQTHCGKSDSESGSTMWFELLDSVIEPQNRVGEEGDLLPFKDLVKHVVNSSMGYVNLRYGTCTSF